MKPKFYLGLILLLLCLVNENVNAQSPDTAIWAWAKSLSSTYSIYGNAIAIDPNGSGEIYVAGGFEGEVDFDPGPGIFNLKTGSPRVGIFISKFDASGNFLWAKAMTGLTGSAFAVSIAIDPAGDGSIYTTGRIKGTIDFDPGSNTFTLNSNSDDCTAFPFCGDIFISKLDHEGNFVWATVMGGSEDDFGTSLAIDPGGNGDVYISGQFKETVDFDPSDDSTFNLTSAGFYDIFISKLNSSGHLLWAKAIGGNGNDVSRAIAFDPAGSGNLYAGGYFQGTVDFDPGEATYNLTAPAGQQNFIAKLSSAGNLLWAKQLGRVRLESLDNAGSIALDPAGNGEVYATGSFQGEGDFDPSENTFPLNSKGLSDIFISRLSGSGEFKWAGAMGGKSQDYGTLIAIQPGGSGNVFTLGRFKGLADFDPGVDSSEFTSIGAYDIFISKIDSAGNFNWVKTIKGVNEDYISAIAIDGKFLYLTGFFNSSSVSFDAITIPNINTSGTGDDLFLAKLDFVVATAELDSKTQKINLFPNPATNELTIEVDGDEFFNVDITLFNTLGEIVYYRFGVNIGQKKTIDISALSAGIYFVELKREGNSVVEKVVKQ